MKLSKRLMALLLCILMFVTMLPVSVLINIAATFADRRKQ